MQLMPSTAAGIAGSLGLARYDLKNPDTNIRFGCSMLRWLRDTFGNNEADILIGSTLARNISRWKQSFHLLGLNPPWPAILKLSPMTRQNYIKLVLSNLSIYRYSR